MSASSEIVDSGRFSGQNLIPSKATEKSSFSQTCNLFSQYLKENATFPDLTLGRRTTTPSTATMNLFPMAETPPEAVKQQTTVAGKNQSTPMTIFYNGQVMVFNDLSPEKVAEILMLAGKGVIQNPTKPELSKTIVQDSIKIQRQQPVVADLPIARKASLARFLEKRKDRITARSPYQTQVDSKQEDSKTWLGLGAQYSHVQF